MMGIQLQSAVPAGCFAELRGERRTVVVLALVAITWAIAWGVFVSYEPKSPSIDFPTAPSEPLFDLATGLNRYATGAPRPSPAPVDSRGLRRAHLALLLLLASVAVTGCAVRNRWNSRLGRIALSAAAIIVAAALALLPAACIFVVQQATLKQRLGGVFGLAVLFLLARYRKRKLVQWPALAACIGLIVLFAIPGRRLMLTYTTDWDLTEIRMEHWVYVISHADRLLHGARLHDGATPSYGQLATLANVALQKLFGEFTMQGHLAFIVGLQTVAMIALLRTYHFLSRGVWLLCCPALVVAGCNFYLLTWLEPNHSAWRYFILWVVPWVWTRLAAVSVPLAALGAGLMACLAVIHNFETGVAAAARTDAILGRAEYLKSRASPGLVFFTVDCYPIAKISRCWPRLPVADIFWECLHAQQFSAAWKALEGGQIEEVLLDPHDWLTSNTCQLPVCASERRYLLAVRERIAREFDFAGAEAGWEVWRRRR